MRLYQFSLFSSLNVDPAYRHDFEDPVDYCQKFSTEDIITLQALATSTNSDVIPKFYISEVTEEEVQEDEITPTVYPVDKEGYSILYVIVSSSISGPGYYKLSVYDSQNELDIQNFYFRVFSEDDDEIKNTVRIRYSHDLNEFDARFVNDDETLLYSDIRFEGAFRRNLEQQNSQTSSFRDQDYYYQQLSSNAYTSRTLSLGDNQGLAGWVGEKLNYIFSLNDITITTNWENRSYVRFEDSPVTVEEIGGYYPKYIYTIQVEKKTDRFGIYPFEYNNELLTGLRWEQKIQAYFDDPLRIFEMYDNPNVTLGDKGLCTYLFITCQSPGYNFDFLSQYYTKNGEDFQSFSTTNVPVPTGISSNYKTNYTITIDPKIVRRYYPTPGTQVNVVYPPWGSDIQGLTKDRVLGQLTVPGSISKDGTLTYYKSTDTGQTWTTYTQSITLPSTTTDRTIYCTNSRPLGGSNLSPTPVYWYLNEGVISFNNLPQFWQCTSAMYYKGSSLNLSPYSKCKTIMGLDYLCAGYNQILVLYGGTWRERIDLTYVFPTVLESNESGCIDLDYDPDNGMWMVGGKFGLAFGPDLYNLKRDRFRYTDIRSVSYFGDGKFGVTRVVSAEENGTKNPQFIYSVVSSRNGQDVIL